MSKHTSIPVPKVIALDNSRDNKIGFEWILMDFMPGTRLEDVWRLITWFAKCKLVETVIDITAAYFDFNTTRSEISIDQSTCQRIFLGLLTMASSVSIYSARMVSMAFFWEKHITLDIPRGPFSSTGEWLAAILAHKKYDNDKVALTTQEDSGSDSDSDDEDELTPILFERLSQTMPKIFPPTDITYEKFALRHDDMHQQNLMLSTSGELTALVDWECVYVVPLWKVCQLPSLLEGRERNDAPQPETYSRNDDGTVDEMYDEHMLEYDLTRLRKLFFERMKIVEPGWMAAFRASEAKADFGYAVENCDTPFCRERIGRWLDNVIAGVEQPGLRYSMIED